MTYKPCRLGKILDIELDFQEDILPALEEIVQKENIQNAVIFGGLGGFQNYVFACPAADQQASGQMALADQTSQISSLQGYIWDGEAHISSVATADNAQVVTLAGKIEKGCIRKFYCQCVLAELILDCV